MMAKIAEIVHRPSKLISFLLSQLGQDWERDQFVTSWVEAMRQVCSLASKQCRITAKEKRLQWSL